MCSTVSELTWLRGEIIACRIVGSFMRGLRWPRTQSTEREEAWQRPQPVLVTMGLMLHLRHHTIIHPRSATTPSSVRTSTFTTTYLEKNYNTRTFITCVAPRYALSIITLYKPFVVSRSLVCASVRLKDAAAVECDRIASTCKHLGHGDVPVKAR